MVKLIKYSILVLCLGFNYQAAASFTAALDQETLDELQQSIKDGNVDYDDLDKKTQNELKKHFDKEELTPDDELSNKGKSFLKDFLLPK